VTPIPPACAFLTTSLIDLNATLPCRQHHRPLESKNISMGVGLSRGKALTTEKEMGHVRTGKQTDVVSPSLTKKYTE
jgi:hypothetical protein